MPLPDQDRIADVRRENELLRAEHARLEEENLRLLSEKAALKATVADLQALVLNRPFAAPRSPVSTLRLVH